VELDEFDRRLLDALQQDSRRTGEQLAALVGLSPAACLRRAQRLRAPEVMQCYDVTGATDFVLIVSVADMEEYEDFTKRLLFEKYVRRFETMVVIECVKFETTVPIADNGPA
jgi:Lrp/AsnC family transcriptional regulator, leucine-responsive regulatory protein